MCKNNDIEKLIETLKHNDFDGYISFLKDNMPKYIYRYMGHTSQNIDMICSDKVGLSNPSSFNDPFDSLIQVVNKTENSYRKGIDWMIQYILASKKKWIERLRDRMLERNVLSADYPTKVKIIKEEYNSLVGIGGRKAEIELMGVLSAIKELPFCNNQYIGDFVSDSKVACFSENESDIVMWAHYGRMHSGICVQYTTDKLLDVLSACKDSCCYFVPVYYCDKMYEDYYKSMPLEDRLEPLWNLPQFMYKHTRWSYEGEWRLVLFDTMADEIIFPCAMNIYLGTSFEMINRFELARHGNSESEQVDRIINLFNYARSKGIGIIPLKADETMYKLEEQYLFD